MDTLDSLSHNLRHTFENISDGWQQLWSKTRNAITYFSPDSASTNDAPVPATHAVRWGLLSADVKETNSTVDVHLEVPGMSAENFEIDVDNKTLRVHGTKNYSSDRQEGRYHVTERAYGRFERLIPLPCPVDESKAKAKYEQGVLDISLPKSKENNVRRIPVK